MENDNEKKGGIRALLFSGEKPQLRSIISALIYFLALLILDVGFRWIYRQNDTGLVSFAVPSLFSLCWSVLLSGISLLLPRLARRIFTIATTLIYSVLALVHAFFFSFFGTYMSLSAVMFAGDGADFFDWSYFNIPKKLLLLLVICIALGVLSALILAKTKYTPANVIIPILLVILGTVGVNVVKVNSMPEDGFVAWNSSQSALDTYESFTDTKGCMHIAGLYQYTFRDISVVTGLNDFVESLTNTGVVQELDTYYAEKKIDPDNEMTGIFEGKNLLLIQLESIDTWSLTETAMPNLSKIREQSIDFTEFYAPKYLVASTFNTENIANTGLVSPMNSSKISYFTETSYPYSLANLFKAEGYTANSFHRSNGGIYNRAEAHVNWGYEKYYSGGDMALSDYDLDSYLMEAYELIIPQDESFLSFVITYTGHGPFGEDSKAVQLHYDTIKSSLDGEYEQVYIEALAHAYETDVFIGELFEKMEADGSLDDTVVVFYSDHFNHYVADDALLAKYKGTDDANMMCNVPFFIYSKGTEAQTVTKPVASYDILPTLVNLFGLDYDGRYYLGNDAFSDNGGYIIFSDRSWYDGETYFNVYESEPTELSAARAEEINTRLDMCWNTIKTDYMKDHSLNATE